MNLKSFTPRNLVYRSRLFIDRLRRLDFMTFIEPEDVGLDPKYTYRSSPSGNKYLVNVLNDLNISAQDSILDIGCGKGSAMRKMLKFPFARIEGIEISEQIAAIATQNFKRLHANRCRIFICDASLFRDYDAYNMVYFYNPFPNSVMSNVIDSLIRSIQSLERELIIVYNNPTCHDIVIGKGVFSKIADYPDEWGNGIFIYSNRDSNNSRLFTNKSRQ